MPQKNRKINFFSESCSNINTENALQATIEADYRKLAKIIDLDPVLIFTETSAYALDGIVISSNPLKYALNNLDILACKYFESVCKRDSKYMDQFISTLCSVDDIPDMSPLYDAYEHFIDLGKKYHTGARIEFEALKKSWLSVGLQQRFCLPRHLLKDMCYCTPNDLIYTDVLLMRVEPLELESPDACKVTINEFEAKLRRIMKDNEGSPIILFNGTTYQEVYLGLDDNIIWDGGKDKYGYRIPLFSKTSHPFENFVFPSNIWTPVLKAAEQNSDNIRQNQNVSSPIEWNSKKTLLCPFNNQTLYRRIDSFFKQEAPKNLFPFYENSDLGYDYALARGFCPMSLGLSDPSGASRLLYAKAQEDYKKMKDLIELRIEEREELVKEYSNENALSL